MTRRILITPSRVAVSRPGYDVASPPAVTTDYLAVDSSFAGPLRLYQTGVVFNRSIAGFGSISFGTTFGSLLFPFVWIMPIIVGNPTTIDDLYMKWVAGSSDNYYNPFNLNIFHDHFVLGSNGDATNHDLSYDNANRNWIYAVYAP